MSNVNGNPAPGGKPGKSEGAKPEKAEGERGMSKREKRLRAKHGDAVDADDFVADKSVATKKVCYIGDVYFETPGAIIHGYTGRLGSSLRLATAEEAAKARGDDDEADEGE